MAKIGVFVPFRNVRDIMRISNAVHVAQRIYRSEASRKKRLEHLKSIPPEEILSIIEALTLYLDEPWSRGSLAITEYGSIVAKTAKADEQCGQA